MSVQTIGVIGCGGHLVTAHLPFLGTTRVIGIYDPAPANRADIVGVLGYEPAMFSSPRALVASRPDAILIGSPDQFHPEQLTLAVDAGIPVLCEKPLAINSAGLRVVQKALALAQDQNLRVATCHQRRSALDDLPYGWVKSNLEQLERRFGRLKRIGLNSNYPQPRQGWKHDRSFLADKFVHDIDYLRFLLGKASIRAERRFDSHDHYIVTGSIIREGERAVEFTCEGTRLHNDRSSFIEYIMLNFQAGHCVVYTKPGLVRYPNNEAHITPMAPESYDRLNRSVTEAFIAGRAMHSPDELLANTTAVAALVGPEAHYKGR